MGLFDQIKKNVDVNKIIDEVKDLDAGDILEKARTAVNAVPSDKLKKVLGGVLDKLDTDEKNVITERFGLSDGKQKTIEEVAKKLNLPTDKIKSIEDAAISKLKNIKLGK